MRTEGKEKRSWHRRVKLPESDGVDVERERRVAKQGIVTLIQPVRIIRKNITVRDI